jgi:hypothetical protein
MPVASRVVLVDFLCDGCTNHLDPNALARSAGLSNWGDEMINPGAYFAQYVTFKYSAVGQNTLQGT